MKIEELSSWNLWTWKSCCDQILSLKNRLGYDESLWILGFQLLEDGCFRDPFHEVLVFDPASAGPAMLIPSKYNAVPEMYCLLSSYANAKQAPLTQKPLSLSTLNPVLGESMPAKDCADLLSYVEQDWTALQAVTIPFFGERLSRADLSFVVWPLPMLPITLTLWRGDEELPDSGSIYFDESAANYLPGLLTELACLTVWRLKNILDADVCWGYHALKA